MAPLCDSVALRGTEDSTEAGISPGAQDHLYLSAVFILAAVTLQTY